MAKVNRTAQARAARRKREQLQQAQTQTASKGTTSLQQRLKPFIAPLLILAVVIVLGGVLFVAHQWVSGSGQQASSAKPVYKACVPVQPKPLFQKSYKNEDAPLEWNMDANTTMFVIQLVPSSVDPSQFSSIVIGIADAPVKGGHIKLSHNVLQTYISQVIIVNHADAQMQLYYLTTHMPPDQYLVLTTDLVDQHNVQHEYGGIPLCKTN